MALSDAMEDDEEEHIDRTALLTCGSWKRMYLSQPPCPVHWVTDVHGKELSGVVDARPEIAGYPGPSCGIYGPLFRTA